MKLVKKQSRRLKLSLRYQKNLRAEERVAKVLQTQPFEQKEGRGGSSLSRAFKLQWQKDREKREQYRIRLKKKNLEKEDNQEKRLDILLWRSRLVASLEMGRQFIRHGFVQVNGKSIFQGAQKLRIGDEFSLAFPKSMDVQGQKEQARMGQWWQQGPPRHLEVHYGSRTAIFAEKPETQEG